MNEIDVLEWVDPDWREHFIDADQACDFYREYASDEWAKAIEELRE
jgi:hypothetical protein